MYLRKEENATERRSKKVRNSKGDTKVREGGEDVLHGGIADANHCSSGRTQARAKEKCDKEEVAERNSSMSLRVRERVQSGGIKLSPPLQKNGQILTTLPCWLCTTLAFCLAY